MLPFEPHPLLRNPHAQTVAYALWWRTYSALPRGVSRYFETEPETRILGECHWQSRPTERPTIVLVHGLEGSSDSQYMLGIAEKAFAAGWNAVRLNQRNCGGTESQTTSLYHSGFSRDYAAVLRELADRDGLGEIFFAGYSMGGNLVLKMAGDLAGHPPEQLRGVVAVCPALDLSACVDAVAGPGNGFYQRRFVNGLKARMRRKAKLFPGKFDLGRLKHVRTLRDFDELITAKYCGFRGAADYYQQSSALYVTGQIQVPTMILMAQDDPFVPFQSFTRPEITRNPNITLIAPQRGGHCAFISRHGGANRFWGESKVLEYCSSLSRTSVAPQLIE